MFDVKPYNSLSTLFNGNSISSYELSKKHWIEVNNALKEKAELFKLEIWQIVEMMMLSDENINNFNVTFPNGDPMTNKQIEFRVKTTIVEFMMFDDNFLQLLKKLTPDDLSLN